MDNLINCGHTREYGSCSQPLHPRRRRATDELADAVRTGLSTLSGFKLTDPNGYELTVELKRIPEQRLTDDFTDLLLQLGRAAQEKKTGIALFLDEIQFVTEHALQDFFW